MSEPPVSWAFGAACRATQHGGLVPYIAWAAGEDGAAVGRVEVCQSLQCHGPLV